MWLTEVASSSGGHTQFRMNNLRTKIRRRSKYAFSSGPAGGRRREASERVDWEFVGFPSSSNKLSSNSSQQNSSVSPNSSTHFLDSSSGGFSLQQNNQNNSINNKRPQNRPEPPITFNWNEPLHPRNSWSFGAGITIEDSTPPPPVPPRCKQSSRPSPAPPPRPASLYSKLSVPPPLPSSSSSSSADKLYIPPSRKRPRSAGGRSASSGDGDPVPLIPPHRSVPPIPSPEPESCDVPPPPVPRHMHASGIPMALPLSPPAPPPPPHASPIKSVPLSPVYAKPSHFHRDVSASLRSSIESPFYQRPASLRVSSSDKRHSSDKSSGFRHSPETRHSSKYHHSPDERHSSKYLHSPDNHQSSKYHHHHQTPENQHSSKYHHSPEQQRQSSEIRHAKKEYRASPDPTAFFDSRHSPESRHSRYFPPPIETMEFKPISNENLESGNCSSNYCSVVRQSVNPYDDVISVTSGKKVATFQFLSATIVIYSLGFLSKCGAPYTNNNSELEVNPIFKSKTRKIIFCIIFQGFENSSRRGIKVLTFYRI